MTRPAPRVLQVVLSLNPGGTERLVLELTKRLHQSVPMAVCCLDEKGSWSGELLEQQIDVHALRRAPGFHPSLGSAINRLARRHRANVVHCHHYSPFVYGAVARMLNPMLRVVFTEHGRLSDAKPSARRRLVNHVLSRVPSAAFAVSSELREYLVEEGFPSSRLGVIYNGIDLGSLRTESARRDARARLGVPDDAVVIGTIARLDPVKDLAALMRAFQMLATERTVRLLVVGDGPERSNLEALTRALGIEDRVRFLGQRNDARDWLPGCDMYANCSVSEGISLTILEAMAASLPVVATRVGGTPEVIDESCGVLVPPRSPSELGEALRGLVDRPEVRLQLGAAGRRRAEERFSLDRMVGEYLDVYRKVA